MPTNYGQGGYNSPFASLLSAPRPAPSEFEQGQSKVAPLGPFQGFLSGFVNSVNQARDKENKSHEDTVRAALHVIDQIPESPQNNPIKMRLAMNILSSKPGKKHWKDEVFATGDASHKYIEDLWNKVSSVLPTPNGPGNEAEKLEDDVKRKAMGFQISPEMGMAGTEMKGEVGPSAHPLGRVDLSEDPGKYQLMTIQTDESTGEKTALLMDQRTGKIVPQKIGTGITEKEHLAKIRQQTKIQLAQDAIGKGTYTLAAQLAKMTPEKFFALDPEEQKPFYEAASAQMAKQTINKTAVQESVVNKNNEGTKLGKEREGIAGQQKALNDLKLKNGGKMPGTEAINNNLITTAEKRTLDALIGPLDREIKTKESYMNQHADELSKTVQAEKRQEIQDLKKKRDDLAGKVVPKSLQVPTTTPGTKYDPLGMGPKLVGPPVPQP